MMGFSSFILYLLIDFLFSVTVNAYTIPLTTQLRKFGSDTTLKVRRSDHFAKKEIPVFNNLNTIYILDGTMLLASSYYGLKSRRNYLHSTDRGWNYSPFYDDVSMLAMEFGYYIGRDPYITGSLVIENMFLKLTSFIEHVKPLYIAVVFDSSYSFRESLSPEYKANRKKFVHQDLNMINAYNILENRLGCRCFHVNNFEADDVMASIGAWARKRNLNAIHVSNDKDMLQLIDDQTFAMHFHDLTLIGKDEVNEKYGVYPNKLVDFFTLVGDRADNIRGIEGIGRVTAKYLLWYFRTVENLYEELGLKALSMNQYPQSSSMYSTYQFNDYQRPRLPMNQWKRSLSLLSDMVYSYKVRHLIDPENVLYSLLAVDLQEVRLTQRLVKLEQNVPLPRLSSIHDLCYRGGYSFRSGN